MRYVVAYALERSIRTQRWLTRTLPKVGSLNVGVDPFRRKEMRLFAEMVGILERFFRLSLDGLSDIDFAMAHETQIN